MKYECINVLQMSYWGARAAPKPFPKTSLGDCWTLCWRSWATFGSSYGVPWSSLALLRRSGAIAVDIGSNLVDLGAILIDLGSNFVDLGLNLVPLWERS